MSDPRDFLPSKYKASSGSGVSNDDTTKMAPVSDGNSPWSDLAKEPSVPDYQTTTDVGAQAPQEPMDEMPAAAKTAPTPFSSKPKPKNNAKMAGLLVVFFLIVGVFASFALLKQNQDNRQQASETGYYYDIPVSVSCPAGYQRAFELGQGCYSTEYLTELYAAEDAINIPEGVNCPPGFHRLPGLNTPNTCYDENITELNMSGGGKNANISVCPGGSEPITVDVVGEDDEMIQVRVCQGNEGTLITVPDINEGEVGWCWEGTQGPGGTGVSGGVACVPVWDDWGQIIAGSYVWPPECTSQSGPDARGNNGQECHRYSVNDLNTLKKWTDYMLNNPEIAKIAIQQDIFAQNSQDANGDQLPLELWPFLTCGSTTDGYNTIESSWCDPSEANHYCAWTQTVPVLLRSGETVNQTRCYLSNDYYEEAFLNSNLTWSPYNTGCGDGVHDYQGQSTIPGSDVPVDHDYLGDCNTWHFTECLNEGTGVNGYGCDADVNPPGGNNNEEEPDPTPTPTGTQTPTPTPTPTTPVIIPPICVDIEMLDSTGNAMTGDDDSDLRDGDQVRFRSEASGDEDTDITYQFRIWAPNASSWLDITNEDENVSAPNISAVYTIINSGEHVVQSRICYNGECQLWEIVEVDSATNDDDEDEDEEATAGAETEE